MSRSYRKAVDGKCLRTVCNCNAGVMKYWKKLSNGKVRRTQGEIGNGVTYKRMNDVWMSPSDGKMWVDDPKYKRK